MRAGTLREGEGFSAGFEVDRSSRGSHPRSLDYVTGAQTLLWRPAPTSHHLNPTTKPSIVVYAHRQAQVLGTRLSTLMYPRSACSLDPNPWFWTIALPHDLDT